MNTIARVRAIRWNKAALVSETMKNWFEIVALISAGVWAIAQFTVKDEPSRAPNFEVVTDISWAAGPTSDTCYADWDVLVKNESARAFKIARANVTIWTFQPLAPTSDKPVYIDVHSFRPRQTSQYMFNRSFLAGSMPLVKHYAPTGTASHTFEWLLRKPPKPEWWVFRIDLYDSVNAPLPTRWAYDWSEPCATSKRPEP